MPGSIEKTVFISYRRTNIPWALAIYQNLTNQGYDVFFDYLSIKSGDFEQIIIGNIKARAHFILVLTPSALERCSEPEDWLRREIETAMDEKRNIVPLMLESFDFGSPSITKILTGKLEKLKKYNGLRVYSDYFFEGMTKLREQFLNVSLDAVIHPISENAKPRTKEHKIAASKAAPVKKEQLTAQKWFEHGYVLAEEGNNKDGAIRSFSEAIRLNPSYSTAYLYRGIIRDQRGDIEGAIADYTEAIHLKMSVRDIYERFQPVFRDNKGDWDNTFKFYNGNLQIDMGRMTDSYEALMRRGNVLYRKGNLEGAISDFTTAIQLSSEFDFNMTVPLMARGLAQFTKGNIKEALVDYDEAIRLMPDLSELYQARGLAHAINNDLTKALEDFTKAISLQPDNFEIYFNRARVWEQINNHTSAITDYQRYLALGGGKQDGDQKDVEEKIKEMIIKLNRNNNEGS